MYLPEARPKDGLPANKLLKLASGVSYYIDKD